MQTTSSPTSRRPSPARRAAALAIWLALSALLVATAFYGQSREDTPEDALYDPSLAVNGLFLYGILIAASLAIARFFPHPLAAVGFRRFALRWVWIGFAVVIATIVVARIAEPFLHGGEEQGFAPDRWEPEHAAAFAVNSAVVILLGPFAEELFFRGLGVRVVAVWGTLAAIVVTAVIFGLVHGLLGALPPLVFFGLGLAWIRVRAGSVWPSFVTHATYNGLGILLLALAWALDLPTS
jgi:membrane protease YdiL (CAAX protease family)